MLKFKNSLIPLFVMTLSVVIFNVEGKELIGLWMLGMAIFMELQNKGE